jgi:hypothetical protein
MIDVALPSAAQRRSFPPPAARGNRNPTSSHGLQSLSKRRACVRRAQNPAQKSSSYPLPLRTLPAASRRSLTSASSASPKPP